MGHFFQEKFCHQWSLTILLLYYYQRADGQGQWGGEGVETLILLYSKKTQANRELYLLVVRQGCKSGTNQQAKTTLWALLALNFHNPVKGSACCNLFCSPSPCLAIILAVTAVLSPGKVSLSFFSISASWLHNRSWMLSSGLLACMAVVETSVSSCLPTLLAAAPLWKAEGGCPLRPIQLGEACKGWVLAHREGFQGLSMSNCCWGWKAAAAARSKARWRQAATHSYRITCDFEQPVRANQIKLSLVHWRSKIEPP